MPAGVDATSGLGTIGALVTLAPGLPITCGMPKQSPRLTR